MSNDNDCTSSATTCWGNTVHNNAQTARHVPTVHISAERKSTGDVVFDAASAEFFNFDLIFDAEHAELFKFSVIFDVIFNVGFMDFGHRCHEHVHWFLHTRRP